MKKIKTKKHQLSWVKGLTLGMVLVTQPAFSQTLPPLTNENNLPIPSPNITSLPSVLPTYTPGNPFTGTWSLPVASPWLGTFSGTGNSILDNTVSGTTTYDFTTGLGQLPIGTYFNFADVDGGSGGGEIFTLQAFDSSNNQIVEPWLSQPISVRSNIPSQIISSALPSSSFGGGTYTIDGGDENAPFNPNVSFTLINLQPISRVIINKQSTFNGFSISAPVQTAKSVPEPNSSLGLLTFGLISLGLCYHRRVKKDS